MFQLTNMFYIRSIKMNNRHNLLRQKHNFAHLLLQEVLPNKIFLISALDFQMICNRLQIES